jgi:hypothetical protein
MYRVALPEGSVMPARSVSLAQGIEPPAPTVDMTAAMLSAFSQAVAPLMTPLVAQLVEQAKTIGRLWAEVSHERATRRPSAWRRSAAPARASQA